MTGTNSEGYDLYVRATDLLSAGDLPAAKALFQQSYSDSPHPKTAHRLACLHETLGEPTEATEWARIAYAEGPRMCDVATNWAKWLSHLDRTAEAIDLLTQILKSNNTYGPARQLLNSLIGGGSFNQ